MDGETLIEDGRAYQLEAKSTQLIAALGARRWKCFGYLIGRLVRSQLSGWLLIMCMAHEKKNGNGPGTEAISIARHAFLWENGNENMNEK